MSDEARALRWAKDVWRESPTPENEIELGADRVARRFTAPRRPLVPRKALRLAGATAAVLGALAYATRGAWLVPHAPRHDATPAPLEFPLDPALPRSPGPQDLPAIVLPPPAAEPAPLGRAPAIDKKRRTAPLGEAASSSPAGADTTWTEVSDALAAHDHAAAEKLLLELSSQRHDANTRAKAHLGLAQLDEAKNDCESARKHALYAASIPDIEIKTVRRALELAARCTR